jgi:hypothetical protein
MRCALTDSRLQHSNSHYPPPHHTHTNHRLLSESWRALRPPLQDAIKSAPQRRPELVPEAASTAAAAHRLDEMVAARAAAGEAWRQYRRLAAFYGKVRRAGQGGLVWGVEG